MPPPVNNSVNQCRADRNRAVRLACIRQVDKLLEQAADPEFRGTVNIEVLAKDGRLAFPVVSIRRYTGE